MYFVLGIGLICVIVIVSLSRKWIKISEDNDNDVFLGGC
jgi:hypothetical protein